MPFPTSTINTTNLDSDADSPAAARLDLLALTTAVNTIITEAGVANGVALLDGAGAIDSTAVPAFQSPPGTMTLAPVGQIVKIENILRLQTLTTAQLTAFEAAPGAAEGDVAYCTDGAGGSPCVAVYNGTDWLRVTLGAAISAS